MPGAITMFHVEKIMFHATGCFLRGIFDKLEMGTATVGRI